MKRFVCFSGIILVLVALSGLAGARPFAPVVEITGAMADELDAATARNSKIPSSEDVGIIPYPGAKILFTQMNNRSNENGTWIDLPQRIYMGTPDPVEQVVEFYEKNLSGWKFRKIYGVPTFYKKEGEYDPIKDLLTPRIVIAPEFRTRKIMPSSKTTIDIYYLGDN